MPTQNLVQVERDLRALPPGPQTMMYLKRAKDGMVATVPPYLAAAELASREKAAQRQALASGAAPGEQPSVSEQLSQKADLMALQALKKREMDAASASQARTAPMPAPEGAPQPEAQPQGGLDQLPVEFGFDGGGLVAFQEGGMSIYDPSRDPLVRAMNRSQPTAQSIADLDPEVDENGNPRPKSQREAIRAAKAQLRGTQQNVSDYQRLLAQKQAATQSAAFPVDAAQRLEQFYPADAWAKRTAQPATGSPPSPPAAIPPEILAAYGPGADRMPQVQATAQQRPPAAPPGPPQQRPPAAAAPGAPAAAAPAAPSTQQAVEAALMQRLGLAPGGAGLPALIGGEREAAPTMAGTAADVKAAQAQFGLDKAAGEEERRMIAEMQARHAQRDKDRARMGLKAVLGGFSRGYGGAAASDVEFNQRAYAEDMQHQQQMYNLINAINTGNRKEAEKAFEKTVGLQQQRETDLRSKSNTELQSLTSMYGNMMQAGSSKYNSDMHFKAAMLQADRAEASGRRAEKAEAVKALRVLADGQVKQLTAISGELKAVQVGPARKEIKERYDRVEQELKETQARIKSLEGLPEAPAPAPAPTPAPGKRRPLSDPAFQTK